MKKLGGATIRGGKGGRKREIKKGGEEDRSKRTRGKAGVLQQGTVIGSRWNREKKRGNQKGTERLRTTEVILKS